MLKIGLRHFQLAAMAASFPLTWPQQISGMFSVMNTASSAGDQAVALDCQLAWVSLEGSELLWPSYVARELETNIRSTLPCAPVAAMLSPALISFPLPSPPLPSPPLLSFPLHSTLLHSTPLYSTPLHSPAPQPHPTPPPRARQTIDESSPLLWFRSLFVAKALATLLVAPTLIAAFLTFWVVYGTFFEEDIVEGANGARKAEEQSASARDDYHQEGEAADDDKEYRSTTKTRMVVSMLVLAMMFHPSITKTTFSFFKCTESIAGRRLLEADMNVVCDDEFDPDASLLHQSLIRFVAIPALIFCEFLCNNPLSYLLYRLLALTT